MTHSEIISPSAKVATMGSCFAHLARRMVSAGLNYFVAEKAPADMSPSEASANQYGVFSARYGNIYTVRQALQFFRRAFGEFTPKESAWLLDGGHVDPFRPRINARPFSCVEDLLRSRDQHLEHVRQIFSEADWIVLTLGLTEAWRSRAGGAVYPLAPGVAGGNANVCEFVNFTVEEVQADLLALHSEVTKINPEVKFLLTVSPVPLIATYEPCHVLTSTVFSKAVLRVAADYAERKCKNVFYFPSYEIITTGDYYEDDMREVTSLGVDHVMRVFAKHFLGNADQASISEAFDAPIVCDEEEIQASLAKSGARVAQPNARPGSYTLAAAFPY